MCVQGLSVLGVSLHILDILWLRNLQVPSRLDYMGPPGICLICLMHKQFTNCCLFIYLHIDLIDYTIEYKDITLSYMYFVQETNTDIILHARPGLVSVLALHRKVMYQCKMMVEDLCQPLLDFLILSFTFTWVVTCFQLDPLLLLWPITVRIDTNKIVSHAFMIMALFSKFSEPAYLNHPPLLMKT